MSGGKARRGDDLDDATIEALYHAIGLGLSRLNKAMLDFVGMTDFVDKMVTGRLALADGAEAVGKLFTVVSEHLRYGERRGLEETLTETLRRLGGFVFQDLHIDPPSRAVNGDEEILVVVLVGHFRKILDVDVNESRLIVLKGLVGGLGLVFLRYQVTEF